MLNTVRGIYENGVIKPFEKVRDKERSEVIIIFLDTAKEKKNAFFSSAGSWKDVDTDVLKKQIYESRRISTRGKIQL